MNNKDWKMLSLFLGGVLFGSAGFKVLGSRDARKAYTHATAAYLRARDSAMTTATTLRENADDILADAIALNEARAAQEAEVIEDIPQA